ncbi:MAG: flagellar hook-associated protein FlgK [Clostridiales bacterium]|nr:flagellar hook-associated protein FlgK [Clostridiales bacterium]MCF8021765.1 flagellar hook-associated protein FlgK [Clostridiales bacterium]
MSGPGTFLGLEIARRGITANRKSMDTAGHNIANANNSDYSRQEAVHSVSTPLSTTSLQIGSSLGTGVEVQEIRRIRNEYLDSQVRDSTSSMKFWEGRQTVLEQVESIFPEPEGRGLQKVMVNFFSDWHDLNNSPQDAGIKSAVVESGKELSRLLRDSNQQLVNVEESITGSTKDGEKIKSGKIGDIVSRVNELTGQIKDVTENITSVRRQGQEPNDMLDKRDGMLNELAGYIPVRVQEINEDGGIKVTMSYGDSQVKLISGAGKQVVRNTASVELSGSDMTLKSGGENITLTGEDIINNGSGSLVGTISAWQSNNNYIDDIDKLAVSAANAVNALYSPDNGGASNFLEFKGDEGAANIYVNNEYINSPAGLDGTQALNIARLQNREEVPGIIRSTASGEINITQANESNIFKDVNFEFKQDGGSTDAEASYDKNAKTMTVTTDWDNNTPSISSLENIINEEFAGKGIETRVAVKSSDSFSTIDLKGKDFSYDPENEDDRDVLGLSNTLGGEYQGFISKIGSEVKSAGSMVENQDAILQQSKGLQESVSGVSLDEELSQIIQFQYGYQASARVMTTVDNLLDTLINRMAV